MIAADISRARRAEKVDALAAAHILQGAIDALANLPARQLGAALVDLISIDSAERPGDRRHPRPGATFSTTTGSAADDAARRHDLFNLFYENSTRTLM